MPPKKTRATTPSASQPLPLDAAKPTRASSRKRRFSDTSNVSEQSNASAPPAASSKRRKKGKKVEEAEVIFEEDEEVAGNTAGADDDDDLSCAAHGDGEQVDGEDGLDVVQTTHRHVHFGAGANEEEEEEEETATATHVTPHPRKSAFLGSRLTLTPASRKRMKTTMTRSSLPPQLVKDSHHASLLPSSQEITFAPLGELIVSRMKERQSFGGKHSNSYINGDDDLTTDEFMVVESKATVKDLQVSTPPPTLTQSFFSSLFRRSVNGGPQTPGDAKLDITTVSERASLGASAQANWEKERRELQDLIISLSDEANHAKTRLQVLELELRGLGFGEEDASIEGIFHSIRNSFISIQESLELHLSATLPENASFQDVIEIAISNVREFAGQLRTQNRELEEKDDLIETLTQQVQGLIDRLADATNRKEKLETMYRKVDQDLDSRSVEKAELEEELQIVNQERDERQAQLTAKQEEASIHREEHSIMVKNLEKLQLSLEGYRTEETRLTELITTMDENHRTLITKMNKEREETVLELEERIDAQSIAERELEALAEKRQDRLTELETEMDTLETERNGLMAKLASVEVERDTAQEGREAAEDGLLDKNAEAAELERRVDTLEEQLDELKTTLKELQEAGNTQRAQLQAAEADLEDRDADIVDIKQKLQEQGKAANELRGKLFEVQQLSEKELAELKKLMSDRDEQFQTDFGLEVTRREDAEELAHQRAADIFDLQTSLTKIELEMTTGIEQRDARIAELEAELFQKDSELIDLREDLRSQETFLAAQSAQSKIKVEQLEGSIVILKQTITQYEIDITKLQQDELNVSSLHDSEMEDRNTTIAELNASRVELEQIIANLGEEKAGLERRVEQEAEQMLELQNEKSDEIQALQITIREKQHKIQVVEEKAVAADSRWQEVLDARDSEISQLRTTTTTNAEAMSGFVGEYTAFKRRFAAYHERSQAHIAALQAQINSAKDMADSEGAKLVEDGEAMLEELEAMDVVAQLQSTKMVTTTTTAASSSQRASHSHLASQQSSSAAKKGRGRKKREMDSGIGLAEGE